MLDLTAAIRAAYPYVTIDHSFYHPDPEFPGLSDNDRRRIRDLLPTMADVQLDWGRHTNALPLVERRLAVVAKLEVLDGLVPDPEQWCADALLMAASHG